jgi:hypothetical protein
MLPAKWQALHEQPSMDAQLRNGPPKAKARTHMPI